MIQSHPINGSLCQSISGECLYDAKPFPLVKATSAQATGRQVSGKTGAKAPNRALHSMLSERCTSFAAAATVCPLRAGEAAAPPWEVAEQQQQQQALRERHRTSEPSRRQEEYQEGGPLPGGWTQ